MMKKSIASVLVLLILINSIGCYSYSQIKKEDAEKIEKDDEVKITTIYEKVYYLHDVQIKGSKLKGLYYTSSSNPRYRREVEEVVIPTDQIKKIEIKSSDTGLTVLTIIIIIGIPVGLLLYWDYKMEQL